MLVRHLPGLIEDTNNNMDKQQKDYTIAKVSWLTKVKRNYKFDNTLVYDYFRGLISFLQNKGLTTRTILPENGEINDETSIMASDLTSDGFELIKKALDRWTDNIFDKGGSPTDYTLLDKHLQKIRSKKSL